jgi:hypothetical protein
MYLIVDEIESGSSLFQEITTTEDINVVAIRPRIYKHNDPAGDLRVVVTDGDGKQIAVSDWVDISDINSAAYSHTYYRFYINVALKSGNVYRVYVENQGYSFAEGAYVGWCRTLDLGRVTASYSPSVGVNSPFDFEIWERTI